MKTLLLVFLLASNVAYSQSFIVTNYGAIGDSITLNTLAIQKAIDSCSSKGGGKVIIPSGIFLSGTLIMKSNVTLHIDSNGTLKGSANLSDYPEITPALRTYTDNYVQRALIFAENEKNIAFEGKGRINGNGLSGIFITNSNRIFGLRLFSCTNVRYEDLTLQNSAFWMMHNCNIDTLTIKNLTITNHCFGNQDGVNIDACRNVLVENCDIDCNDDPLVMKGTLPAWCENVIVRNCTFATYSRAIKIGTETQGFFRNIHIYDCTVKKSDRGPLTLLGKCGINLSIVDGGSMENIWIENVTLSGINTPFTIRLGNQARKYTPSATTPGVGFVKNIRLKNITANAATNITSSITGIPNYKVENVFLEDVHLTMPGGLDSLPSNFIVPENETGRPENTIFGDTLPAKGIFMRHIKDLHLCGVSIQTLQQDNRPIYVLDDVIKLDSSCITAIQDLDSKEEMKLFPNPASNRITFQNTKATILEIYNAFGSKVFSDDNPLEERTLSLENWQIGLYLAVTSKGKKSFIVCK
jgi:hypothetical protein